MDQETHCNGNKAAMTQSSIRHILEECMRLLDPPIGEPLELSSLRHVYDTLQEAATATAAAEPGRHDGKICHSRVCQMMRITHESSSSSLEHVATTEQQHEWVQDQADLYRALLLTCSLLLELTPHHHHQYDANHDYTIRLLQSSIERCFLLLRILLEYSESFSTQQRPTTTALPTSRYPLLQAVLDEPLVPLHKQERQYMYLEQQCRNRPCYSTNTPNEHEDTSAMMMMIMMDMHDDDYEYDDEYEEPTNVLCNMDKRQLAMEERELVAMAQKEIPVGWETLAESIPVATLSTMSSSASPIHQGTVIWNDDNHPCSDNMNFTSGESKQLSCHMEIHECGVLILHDMESSKRCWYYLTHESTCVPCLQDAAILSFRFEIHGCHGNVTPECNTTTMKRILPSPDNSTTIVVSVDSLQEGFAWVTAIQQVVRHLIAKQKLQRELQGEWNKNDEYVTCWRKSRQTLPFTCQEQSY